MLRKLAVALLLIAVLFGSNLGTAFADGTDDILIKKGEQSDNVILLQLRLQDLGYYDYKLTGFFGDFTGDALKDFQKTNGLTSDGVAGQNTLALMYSNDAKRKTVEPIIKPPRKPTTTKKNTSVKYGKLVSWSTVNNYWKIGMTCTVIDFDTKTTYRMKRCNRSYNVPHADVAPASKSDTNKFKDTYDGSWSWDRRAVIVNVPGLGWVAGSTNGMPHGSTGVAGNGMNLANGHLQQVCIHFLNSRTNIHHLVDPAHQYEVKRAAGKAVGTRPALAETD